MVPGLGALPVAAATVGVGPSEEVRHGSGSVKGDASVLVSGEGQQVPLEVQRCELAGAPGGVHGATPIPRVQHGRGRHLGVELIDMVDLDAAAGRSSDEALCAAAHRLSSQVGRSFQP